MSAIESKEAFSANPELSLVARLRDLGDRFGKCRDRTTVLESVNRIEVLEAVLLYAGKNLGPLADHGPVIRALGFSTYAEWEAAILKEPSHG